MGLSLSSCHHVLQGDAGLPLEGTPVDVVDDLTREAVGELPAERGRRVWA